MTAEKKKKIFHYFRATGLHELDDDFNKWVCNWLKITYCVIKMKSGNHTDVKILKNCNGKHAESFAISEIEIYYFIHDNILSSKTVDMYLNYSPCSDCAQELIEMVDRINISMNIYFVQLYHARRQSCEDRNDRCYGGGDESGLKNLYDCERIKITNFDRYKVWLDLGHILGLGRYPFLNTHQRESRLREDTEVTEDFELIINEIVFDDFFYSGLHETTDCCEQRQACCVSKIDRSSGEPAKVFIKSTTREFSAEEKTLRCLKDYIDREIKSGHTTATIYMNRSPSHHFLEELMGWAEIFFHVRLVKLEGVPHDLCGPQCKTPRYNHHQKRRNKKMIREMNDSKWDTISCFKKKTWKNLSSILEIRKVNREKRDWELRHDEDENVADALDVILCNR